MPESPISNPQVTKGLRWLTIFEQAMTGLIVAAVLGIGTILIGVKSMDSKLTDLVIRLDRMEEQADTRNEQVTARLRAVEKDTNTLQTEVREIQRKLEKGNG